MRIQIMISGFEGLINPSTVIFNLLLVHVNQNPSTHLKKNALKFIKMLSLTDTEVRLTFFMFSFQV